LFIITHQSRIFTTMLPKNNTSALHNITTKLYNLIIQLFKFLLILLLSYFVLLNYFLFDPPTQFSKLPVIKHKATMNLSPITRESVPIVYSDYTKIQLFGLEKLHPFDTGSSCQSKLTMFRNV
jgi:hypothetical protein